MHELEQLDMLDSIEDKKKLIVIKANTDGGNYKTNPGPGGIGIVFRFEKDGKTHIKTICRFIPKMMEIKTPENIRLAKRGKKKKPIIDNNRCFMETTNNRCEILAIIEAMARIKDPEKAHLIVYSDSQWAINITNGMWKPKENLDLVKKARELYGRFGKIEIKWVRGHAGDKYNEWCDELATKACNEQPEKPVVEVLSK